MPFTLTQTPAYPLVGREVRLAPNASAGNFVRLWATDAPFASALRARIDAAGASGKVEVAALDSANAIYRLTPDKPGVYVFAAQEYTRGAVSFGGGYEDSPDSHQTETAAGSVSSHSVYVGQRLSLRIGLGADTADLILHVWNSTIRPTSIDQHGEVTPALVRASTTRARSAAASSAVVSALAALHNVAALTALGTTATRVSDFVAKLRAHFEQAGVHETDDTITLALLPAGIATPSGATIPSQVAALRVLARAVDLHMRTDDGGGTCSGDWHNVSGPVVADWTNLPNINGVTEDGFYAALAELERAYEAHRVSLVVHDAADATNTLSAATTLQSVARAFLAALGSATPTAAANENAGAIALMAMARARED